MSVKPALPEDGVPPWFVVIDHLYGGHTPEEYGVPNAILAGAFLRLEDNLRHGRGDLRQLIERLRDGENRERHFHDRNAEGLSTGRFESLKLTLASHLRVPELELDSTEALAGFVATNPLNHFEGWAVHPVGDDVRVDDALFDSLRSAGRALGLAGAPRSFLVWSNCDL